MGLVCVRSLFADLFAELNVSLNACVFDSSRIENPKPRKLMCFFTDFTGPRRKFLNKEPVLKSVT